MGPAPVEGHSGDISVHVLRLVPDVNEVRGGSLRVLVRVYFMLREGVEGARLHVAWLF